MGRLEEWRELQSDIEFWMHHQMLPEDLREAVQSYQRYKWVATRGVDEESLIAYNIPRDLRSSIKRHLCLELVKQVVQFKEMAERILVAICEKMKPSILTPGTYLVCENYPIEVMFFVIRGNLGQKAMYSNFSMTKGPGDVIHGNELSFGCLSR